MITHKSAKKDVTVFLRETAKVHFSTNFVESDRMVEQNLDFRRFDIYVLAAWARIFYSYVKNLIPRESGLPFFVFSVGNIELGKYVTTSVQRANPRTIVNSSSFIREFHTGLLRAGFVLGAAMRKSGKASAICLGDPWYMDGICIDYFLGKGDAEVYVHIDPYGFILAKNKKNLSSAVEEVKKSLVGSNEIATAKVNSYMSRRLKKPDSEIFYYSSGKQESKLNNLVESELTAFLVYTESFTDSQMLRGYDGFRNGYEWLHYTIRNILEREAPTQIFLKPHPVYFANSSPGSPEFVDRQIWRTFLEGLPEEVKVEDSSITNYEFLKNFSPTTSIAVSHHGNALVEAAWMGFSTISSRTAEWGDLYSFSNVWSSRSEYKELLLGANPGPINAKQYSEAQKFMRDFYMNEARTDVRHHRVANVVRSQFPRAIVDENPASLWPSERFFSKEDLNRLHKDYSKTIFRL